MPTSGIKFDWLHHVLRRVMRVARVVGVSTRWPTKEATPVGPK